MQEILKSTFICEKCKEEFESKESCLEHEKHCGTNRFLLFRYELAWIDSSMLQPIFRLTKYNAKTSTESSFIDLIPGNSDIDRILNLRKTKFEEVYYHQYSNVFYIYTMNTSDEAKEIYVEKLVNHAEKFFYKKEEEIINKRKSLLNNYVTHDYKFIDDGFVKENYFYVGE